MVGGAAAQKPQGSASRHCALDVKIPPERATYGAGEIFDRAHAAERARTF
jgi:hypothetical protein